MLCGLVFDHVGLCLVALHGAAENLGGSFRSSRNGGME